MQPSVSHHQIQARAKGKDSFVMFLLASTLELVLMKDIIGFTSMAAEALLEQEHCPTEAARARRIYRH